jgi:hypothetical protein
MVGKQKSELAIGLGLGLGLVSLFLFSRVAFFAFLFVMAQLCARHWARAKGYSSRVALGCSLIPALGPLVAFGLPNRDPKFLRFKDELPVGLRPQADVLWTEYQRLKGPPPQELSPASARASPRARSSRATRLLPPQSILIAGAAIVLLLVLFPPFFVTLPGGLSTNLGRSFVLIPPKYGVLVGRIDGLTLIAECFAIALITAMCTAFVLVSARSHRAEKSVEVTTH